MRLGPRLAILALVAVVGFVPPAQAQVDTVAFASAVYTVGEGAGNVVLTVRTTTPVPWNLEVDYAVTGGTASAGQDFSGGSGTATFDSMANSTTFSIAILNDAGDETDETFVVTLSDPNIGTVGSPSQATVTILDDDATPVPQTPATPTLWMRDSERHATEADGAIELVVDRTGDLSGTTTVDYATQGVTATSGADFQPAVGTLTFAAGVASQTLQLVLLDDDLDEPDEDIQVFLSGVEGGELGLSTSLVTLQDDDEGVPRPDPVPAEPPTIGFLVGEQTIDEEDAKLYDFGGTRFEVAVVRTGPLDLAMAVSYEVATDGPLDLARRGWDYDLAGAGEPAGRLDFLPGQERAVLAIAIYRDLEAEHAESIVLRLKDPTGGAVLATANHTITLQANESGHASQPTPGPAATLVPVVLAALAVALRRRGGR